MNMNACGETPTIQSCNYSNSVYGYCNQDMALGVVVGASQIDRILAAAPDFSHVADQQFMANTNRRFVQVFIVDPCEDVPLSNSVLVQGNPTLTDLTDQELFFEQPVAELLKKHNDSRVKFLDKGATRKAGKDVFLEPIRIRDLKMLVVPWPRSNSYENTDHPD